MTVVKLLLSPGLVVRLLGGERGEPDLLASCYRESLRLAVAHGITTIAFPAISCGIYGYPVPDAALIAVRTVTAFLGTERSIEQVILACFGREVVTAYQAALSDIETAPNSRNH